MAHLEARAVTRRFGGMTAVDAVSIEAGAGEFVALVGPSGCGKTTTLRIVAGLEAPEQGAILVDGRDVTRVPAKDRNLAMVFQSYALYPHMSVAENIGFALQLQRRGKADIAAAVRAAAERLEIGELLDRRPRELSGGQRQRVAVARAIVREPRAFLFDEPLSNLDARLRASARQEISALQRALGVTTLYVTHDQVEAMTMADRIVLMHEGRVRQAGAPLALYHDPDDTFVAGFLGAPPMNLTPGVARHGENGAVLTVGGLAIAAPAALPEGPATLGLRAETLTPAVDAAAGADTGEIRLPAVVAHVERLGAETILDADTRDAGRVIARLPGTAAFERGAPVTLRASLDACYFFDAAGRRVRDAA